MCVVDRVNTDAVFTNMHFYELGCLVKLPAKFYYQEICGHNSEICLADIIDVHCLCP